MENTIAKKLLKGALIGWGVAFLLMCLIAGEFPNEDYEFRWFIFLSLAPGAVIGIIVTYIINKSNI